MKRGKGKGKCEKNDCTAANSEKTDSMDKRGAETKLVGLIQEDTNMPAVTKSSRRQWSVISSLCSRQQGLLNPSVFVKDACGSHTLVGRLKQLKPLVHHNGCVNTLHFSSSGDLLASGSDDLDIAIWDWAKNKKVLHYDSGHSSNVFQAKFMPFSNDSTVVTCARDGQVRAGVLSSDGTVKDTRLLAHHRGAAHKLSIEPGSPWLFLTCGEDGVIYQVDMREDKANKLFFCRASEHKKVALYTIFIDPSNVNEFAVGGRDHYARVYDRRKAPEGCKAFVEPLKKYCPHHLKDISNDYFTNITCLVYSYDGTELLVSYNDEDIYLFDTYSSSEAEYIRRYTGHRNNATVKGVNFFGPRSEFVVSGSDCGHVFLWDKETENVANYMKGDQTGVVNCLEPHPLASILATSGLDHNVKIWAPLASEPNDLSNLKEVIDANNSEREDDRSRPHDPISEHLIYLMVNHVHQSLGGRIAGGEGDSDSIDFSGDVDDDGDDNENNDNDDDDESPGRVQCTSS